MSLIKRDSDKVFFCGVCSGISKNLNINLFLLRFLWFLSIFYYGIGIILYILMCILLKEDNEIK